MTFPTPTPQDVRLGVVLLIAALVAAGLLVTNISNWRRNR